MVAMTSKTQVAVAMSGGVDSSVAAVLLKEQGYDVVGIYMQNWTDEWGSCHADEEHRDALQVAVNQGIPFRVFDFEKEYRAQVIEYFFNEYRRGRTPNPDVECNRLIKFGLFVETALKEEGVDMIATGHYARVQDSGGRYSLLKGVDHNKDQSYFLWTLGQEQLARTLFPIGEMRKDEVREKARELGIHVADKKDSTGICFVGEGDIVELLKKELNVEPGPVLDENGEVIGEHEGAWFYTLGQRRGLGVSAGVPYYVARVDVEKNILHAAPINDPALFSRGAVLENLSWVAGEPEHLPLECSVKIRYRQPDQAAVVRRDGSNNLMVEFEEEQKAMTPGQSAVFYDHERLMGGGVISRIIH